MRNPVRRNSGLITRSVNVTVDASGVTRRREATVPQLEAAAERTVRKNTRAAEKALEAATRAGTRGNLWRAWASEIYTKNRQPGRFVGFIFPKGGAQTRGALTSAAYGASIRGRGGNMLAIPFPFWREKLQERGRYATALTPAKFTRRTGLKLRPLARRGKPTLLIVDWRASGKAQPPGGAVTPVFVLLPEVSLSKRFSVEATIAPFQQLLPADFTKEVRATIAREWGV